MKSIARWEIRILYGVTFILVALVVLGLVHTNHIAYKGCKRVQTLQGYALETIQRSEKTLPTISYYKNPDHRNELVTQLTNLRLAEKDFTPIKCSNDILGD